MERPGRRNISRALVQQFKIGRRHPQSGETFTEGFAGDVAGAATHHSVFKFPRKPIAMRCEMVTRGRCCFTLTDEIEEREAGGLGNVPAFMRVPAGGCRSCPRLTR